MRKRILLLAAFCDPLSSADFCGEGNAVRPYLRDIVPVPLTAEGGLGDG